MATVYQELSLDAAPSVVWAAVRDVGAVHECLFPGYLTDSRMEEPPSDGASVGSDGTHHAVQTRVVTFANGLVVRERIVAVDDDHRRIAWSAIGGRASHHHASMQVRSAPRPDGSEGSLLVWVTDVLPDELSGAVGALVEGGAAVLRETFAATASSHENALDDASDARTRETLRAISPMLDALHAAAPTPRLARQLALFGRLVGSWELDVTYFAQDGSVRRRVAGEWHFGWALEGRAIVDVWMIPPRAVRDPNDATPGEYGLSLRFFDERIAAWRSTWHGPVRGIVWPFVVREVNDEIVLERTDESGRQIRWIFSSVTADSFHWRAVESSDGGATWRLEQTMDAVRRPTS